MAAFLTVCGEQECAEGQLGFGGGTQLRVGPGRHPLPRTLAGSLRPGPESPQEWGPAGQVCRDTPPTPFSLHRAAPQGCGNWEAMGG